ncbi:DMT family transporter [Sinisalibacter aestuarii]|uniref:Multidrug transporter n=1 Tax=Sinisalibacter aestuarii TaxID=2949426 RepID=A0ABQ5LU72_9RHOB|nr:DMT family transporter [Sinisalibacter aestuarii]GKY87652.1 multidrug transporter [Sinisalibacter aestuarii]
MTQASLSPRAWMLLILLSLIWGSSFLTTTTLVGIMAPLHVVTHRVLWAALFLWAYVLVRRLPLPRDRGTVLALLVMGAANNAIPFALQAYAQQSIESGLAGILNATTAIFGPLMAAIFLADERLTRRKATGVALGFFGVAVILGLDSLRSFDLRALAQLAMLGSTMAYALSSVWARKRLRHLRPEVAALGMLTGAALIMLPLSWLAAGPLPLALPPDILAAIAYYALVVTAGAYLLYYAVINIAGAGNATLVTLLIVPTAVALGAMVRAEALPLSAYLGFGLIALGLVVIDGRLFRRR